MPGAGGGSVSSNRLDPEKCHKGLHDWETSKRVNSSTGREFCGACDDERRRDVRAGEREQHPQNAGHCRKGHPYTLENTQKRARMIKGKKVIERSCRRCNHEKKYDTNTTRR